MIYRCLYSRQDVDCLASLGKGGEGEVYTTDIGGMVAKIYHQHKRPGPEMIAKLRYMIANTPEQPQSLDNHIAITWPRDLLERDGVVHGFLMDASVGEAVEKAVTPSSRKKCFPGQTWRHSLAIAHNLSWVVANLHAKDYVIGDVNEQNFRTRTDGVVSIIDIDSFQIIDAADRKIYPCTVMTPDFAAPELTADMMKKGLRRPDQDCFSLAIIMYRLLMCGNHPFNGVYLPEGESPEQRVAIVRGYTVFDPDGPYAPRPKAPPLSILPPSLAELFARTFVRGHGDPAARPGALEWKEALWSVLGASDGIIDCADNPLHAYGAHLSSCPWCELAEREHIDYYDPRVAPPRTQVNRPRIYAAHRSAPRRAVSGMQVHVPVRPLQTLRAPSKTSPGQAGPASGPNPPPSPGAGTGGAPTSPGAVGAVGYCLRFTIAVATLALFIWLNMSSLVWPYPRWDRFVRKATEMRLQAAAWLDGALERHGIRLPGAEASRSTGWGSPSSPPVPATRVGGDEIEVIVPRADGPSDSYRLPAR